MADIESLRRILAWSATAQGAVPDLRSVDDAAIEEALLRHRLHGRFAKAVEQTGAPVSAALRHSVAESVRSNRKLVQQQIELFHDLRRAVRDRGADWEVLPLKGFLLYLLTQRPEHLRYSADIDVIGADPQAVADAALALRGENYHHHGEEHPYVFAHMDDIEVHFRYQVTGFGPGAAEPWDPQRTTGPLALPGPFSVSSIGYDDLREGSQYARHAGLEIPHPRPELAAIIRCAHIYVGYAMDPRPLPLATVRLDEVAQVIDLLRLPGFSRRRFYQLCARFDAGLVASFTRWLGIEILGVDPLGADDAVPAALEVRQWYPTNLWWDGIGGGLPVRLPVTAGDLVVRGDVPELARLLHAEPVRLGDGEGDGQIEIGGGRRRRVIYQDSGRPLPRQQFQLRADDHGLQLTALLPPCEADEMSAIGLAVGDQRFEVFHRPEGGLTEVSDYSDAPVAGAVEGSASIGSAGERLGLRVSWAGLGFAGRPGAGARFNAVLRSRQQDRPWGDVEWAAVVPLEVQC